MVEYDENTYVAELRSKPICRFCLSQEDTLTNIYSTSNTNSQVALSMQIMACVSIEVIYRGGVHACEPLWAHVDGVFFASSLHEKRWHSIHSVRVSTSRHWGWKKNNEIAKVFDFHGFFPLVNWQQKKQKIIAENSSQTNHIGCMYWESGNLSRTSSHSLYAPLIYVYKRINPIWRRIHVKFTILFVCIANVDAAVATLFRRTTVNVQAFVRSFI